MASLDTLFLYSDVDEGEGSIMKKVTNGDIGERGAKIWRVPYLFLQYAPS